MGQPSTLQEIRYTSIVEYRLKPPLVPVFVVFGAVGFIFSTWASRLPALREALSLDAAQLGLLLLAMSIGSISSLVAAGTVVERLGTKRAVITAILIITLGTLGFSFAALAGNIFLTGVGFFFVGLGNGTLDVGMNSEGAHVERQHRRIILPQLHGLFSLGSVVGAGFGSVMAGLGVGFFTHFLIALGIGVPLIVWYAQSFILPPTLPTATSKRSSALHAWRNSTTVFIGVFVLSLALAEGVGTDWLALAMVEKFNVSEAAGAFTFTMFVSAMTIMRFVGKPLLERFGRVRTLRMLISAAFAGLLVATLTNAYALATLGALLLGFGVALGFPMGMSAVSERSQSAASVSVVASIGYGAFLAGPPLLGALAKHVGIANALLAVAPFLVLSYFLAPLLHEHTAG